MNQKVVIYSETSSGTSQNKLKVLGLAVASAFNVTVASSATLPLPSVNAVLPVYPIASFNSGINLKENKSRFTRSSKEAKRSINSTNSQSISDKHMKTLMERVESLAELKKGWDGYSGEPLLQETINNTLTFLKEMPKTYVDLLEVDNLYPTPYGTISIEWGRADDQFISVEIGTEKLAYFYEILENYGESSGNLDFSQKQYSQNIISALKNLYHTELING